MSDPVFRWWTLLVILIKLKTKNNNNKAIPIFFRLPSNAFPDIRSVCRIEKKKPKKKITRSFGIVGPGTPGRRQKLTFTYLDEQNAQHSVKNVPVFVPVFLYPVTMLNFRMKRIISSEKRLNSVVALFVLKMPKIWVGRTTVNWGKKGDGLMCNSNV